MKTYKHNATKSEKKAYKAMRNKRKNGRGKAWQSIAA